MPKTKEKQKTSIWVLDQYQQRWEIKEGDPLYEEALKEVEEKEKAGDLGNIVWPLSKISQSRGWGWWTIYHNIEDFETALAARVPHPGKQRLLQIDSEYTPTELQDMLQQYGSYLATLHYEEGVLEAHCHALKEGLKTGIAVAVASYDNFSANTVSGKEAEVMAASETFRNTRKMQIESEAILAVVKGWRHAYEAAWDSVSRIVSLRSAEVQLQTGRHA